jgi:hypothetical protein
MTKLLLSKGADVKARALYTDWPNQLSSEPRGQYRPVGGLTALLYASRDGCSDCVAALIGAGADVNVPTPEGVTPLMISLDNDHNDVATLLLDRGANPHVADWWGRTALWIVIDRKEALAGGRGGRGAAGACSRLGPGWFSHGHHQQAAGRDVDVNAELNMHRPSRGGNSGRFADRQLARDARRCIAQPRPATWKSFDLCWPRAPTRTSTTWASRHSWWRQGVRRVLAEAAVRPTPRFWI